MASSEIVHRKHKRIGWTVSVAVACLCPWECSKVMCEYFLASTIPHMVWFARIEEIEGQNLKDNILVRFWSPLLVFFIFFENQCGFKKLLQI